MKYQGFYDYALGDDGKPDRTFTAQQFCRHLSAIFGNGIVITNATGNDAWKVEKIGNEDLKVKIKLGDNNFNFASLRGNPFAIDEELTIELSQGSDRWDAIMIRADATSTVRATDIKVTENSIALVRNDTIFDLRLARVHIVNNVITEVIDDRLNNDYCGIAAGLATINTDDILNTIKSELENIENGQLVALKNGALQTNLNVEKLGGKTLDNIMDQIKSANDLVQKYNLPRILKNDNNYNYFELDNIINQYDIGMRVFIEFKNTYFNKFTESIIPVLTNASTPVNGFYYTFQQQSTSAKDIQNIYDKDDSTFGKMYKDGTSLFFPSGIKNFKVKVKTPGKGNGITDYTINLLGRQKGTTAYNSLGSITYTDSVATIRYFEINDNIIYDSLKISMSSSGSITTTVFQVYTFDVVEGYAENYNSTLPIYLNINNLGNKLINGALTENKRYLLVYDGTVFNATEVV